MLKYLEFLRENIKDLEKIEHSLGEWVENLCKNDREILELMRIYLEGTNPSVRISNTINVLTPIEKSSVYKIISDYLNNTGRESEIIAFVDYTIERNIPDVNTSEIKAGKNIFNSFLRFITSLGLKDIKPNWDSIPDDFLLFFEYKTEYLSAIEKIERFDSLANFKDKLPKENCKLYYGIKNDSSFVFGFMGENLSQIGSFKMNNSTIKYLQLLNSTSAAHLKKELAFLDISKLPLMCKISKYMKLYHPGNTEKRTFKINDGRLEFGYQGLGSWNNRQLSDIDSVRNGFLDYLRKFKEANKIKFKVVPGDNFYIYCIIEMK